MKKLFRLDLILIATLIAILAQFILVANENFIGSASPNYGLITYKWYLNNSWPCFDLIPDGLIEPCNFYQFIDNLWRLVLINNIFYVLLPTLKLMGFIYFLLITPSLITNFSRKINYNRQGEIDN